MDVKPDSISTPQAIEASTSGVCVEPVQVASTSMAFMALAVACMAMPEHAVAHEAVSSTMSANPQFDLAEGQEFWGNVARYGRYFVTVMLGTGYVMLRPFAAALKNPVSAIFAILGVVGGAVVLKFTLEAMLGVSADPLPFDYVQGKF
eukprot:CAMPEP_0202869246 /NCGR_PEP_ID=MMETSP1391-20130828/12241_1 /ASSEMBLY_ACC=CAM_ASM_000867 /TAXON_ID=1034604 /ORGANISM="Chlamydomonas leiostraca, Strain SAG 11-49" /LENGTH=147 /DNA_ID=CAMNT_0049549541 /DNA_START=190 /DNA_END=633 /DNA_ORIENTATION=+